MVKIYKLLMIILISVNVFSKPLGSKYYNQIEKERKSVSDGVEKLKNGGKIEQVYLTGVSNEAFLEQVGAIKQKLNVGAVHFIFPDVKYVDKYIKQVSKNIPLIFIYLMDEKSSEEGLEFRDLATFHKLNLKEKLEKLGNIIVISINVKDEDKKKIIPNSFNKKILEDEIVKKYIIGQ